MAFKLELSHRVRATGVEAKYDCLCRAEQIRQYSQALDQWSGNDVESKPWVHLNSVDLHRPDVISKVKRHVMFAFDLHVLRDEVNAGGYLRFAGSEAPLVFESLQHRLQRLVHHRVLP